MRNRRSFFESQKERFVKEAYENNPNNFVLNSVKYIERNSADEMLEEEFTHRPGFSSSAEIENKFRYALVSNLETTKNILDIKEEQLITNHRSYINAFKDIERKYDKLEREANRELLTLTDDTPFLYGVTDNLSTQEFVDEDRTTAYWYGGQFMLPPKSFKRTKLNIRNVSSNLKVRGGSLKEINELSNKNNIFYKDGSNYKIKAETSNAYCTVELELIIELDAGQQVDKLEVVCNAVEGFEKESIRVIYSKDGARYLSPEDTDYERISSGFNTFDIYDSDIRIIKIFMQKNAADSSFNNKNEYLFSIDFVGNVEYVYESQGEVYLGPYMIKDVEGVAIDFDMAAIKTGTCCVVPNETSIDFSISKDGENYIPISYFNNASTVVEFKNQINENIFLLTDPNLGDLVRSGNEYRLNRYIPEGLVILEQSLIVRRGVGKWIESSNGSYSTTIEIENIEGRFFDLGNTSLKVNGTTKTGMLFLDKGIYEIESSSEYYEEFDTANISSEEGLKIKDSKYPYNHKYMFEGMRYSRSFIGNKVYIGVKSFFSKQLKKVETLTPNVLNEFVLEHVVGEGTYIKVNFESTGEQFYIDCKSEAKFDNNEVYLKAVLKSNDQYKTPRIDAIQIRVV